MIELEQPLRFVLPWAAMARVSHPTLAGLARGMWVASTGSLPLE